MQQISLEAAGALVQSGNTVLVGGFGLAGTPVHLIRAVVEHSTADNLTIISNNCGFPGKGLGELLLAGRIRHAIGSFFSPNPDVVQFREAGKLAVTLIPQGTLAESLRAGGVGIPAYYTPSAVGTTLADGKETRVFDGREYVMERALRGNIALVKAHRADAYGNLTYRKAGRNFNPLMAMAADTVIVEVEELVPLGTLSPEEIVTPHVFVDYVVVTGGSGGLSQPKEDA